MGLKEVSSWFVSVVGSWQAALVRRTSAHRWHVVLEYVLLLLVRIYVPQAQLAAWQFTLCYGH